MRDFGLQRLAVIALLVALADCTASSRMRCRHVAALPSAPSAVCASEMPSLALRGLVHAADLGVMRSAIARPAASSLALLMRRPEDRRCMAASSDDCEPFRLRCAFNDAMLVLMVMARDSPERLKMGHSRLQGPCRPRLRTRSGTFLPVGGVIGERFWQLEGAGPRNFEALRTGCRG